MVELLAIPKMPSRFEFAVATTAIALVCFLFLAIPKAMAYI
ncbi:MULTISPECIES: hypothetical protein [unclassified Microcoleus]